jgi:hypothetical protein
MTENTDGYAVAVRRVRISADAARAGRSPYLEDGLTYARFCDDEPGGISGASAKRADETVFRTREEAERAAAELLARNAAKARTERDFRPGLASQLAPEYIGGVTVGGYEIVSRSALVAERAEEAKLAEDKVRAKLALETEKAAKQQALVEKIGSELAGAKEHPTPDGGVLRHDVPRGIQQETRADGTSRFRARKTAHGKTLPGPWCPTIEEATSGWSEKHGRDWETDQPTQTEPVQQPRAMVVGIIEDPEAAGLT